MAFFSKIKQFLGIGGIKVEVACDTSVPKDAGNVSGTIKLTSKSDQHVLTLGVKMVEEYTTGRGDDKSTQEIELGTLDVASAFDMKAGEEKVIEFSLPFELVKSNADELKEKGGALGALGSVAKFANAEKSEYFIEAECDVKGTALDPSGKIEVQLV